MRSPGRGWLRQYADHRRPAADFTSDRAALLAAVERFRPRPGGATMWKMIRDISTTLAMAPQQRKAMVLISSALAITPLIGGTSSSNPLEREEALATSSAAIDVFRDAQTAMIAMYPVDPGGLVAPGADDVRKGIAFPGQASRDGMLALASFTGGHAIVDTNDFEPGLTQIFRENSSYYLLGYSPDSRRAEGKYRRLSVQVNRPGVRVNARRGYYEPRAIAEGRDGKSTRADDTAHALAGPLPTGDLPMQATVAAFPAARGHAAPVVISVWLRPAADQRAPVEADTVTVVIEAFTLDGHRQAGTRTTVQAGPTLGASPRLGSEVVSRLDLEPGRYQIRMAASSARSSTAGSVYYDLAIPDGSRDPVTLSGVLIGITPGPSIIPRAGLPDLLPLAPTAIRTFPRSARVKAFCRMMQGGKDLPAALPIAIRIVDERGATVFESHETIEAGRFAASRTADYVFDLPISRLQSGQHLLTILAGPEPTAARRDVRFTVQ